MRRFSLLSLSACLIVLCGSFTPQAQASNQPKDWTFLIFLNGNNSLDRFGEMNLKQLEKVGSSDRVNIVVQWASLDARTVKRMLIQKSTDGSKVTSPVIEYPKADMGDWHAVVDFVNWGAKNFPADHYFLDLWDHGSGWHSKSGIAPQPNDISWDEITGHHITTQEMGLALDASAKIIGHKVDLYASDACLMAMVEIANEMSDSVSVYAGSQETEPGAGWPYDKFMARWVAKPSAQASEVATMLSEEYAKSYQKPAQAVTFSAYDLEKLPALNSVIKTFAASLKGLNANDAKAAQKVAQKSQYFTNSDYVDFNDFLTNLNAAKISGVNKSQIGQLNAALKDFVITSNNVKFPKAHGVSIWLPGSASSFARYSSLYSQLKFDQATHWSDFLKTMNP